MDRQESSPEGDISMTSIEKRVQLLTSPQAQPIVSLPGFSSKLCSANLRDLLHFLGCSDSTSMTVGWWNGFNNIEEYRAILGKPLGTLCLLSNSDLDWTVWRSDVETGVRCVLNKRYLPGFLLESNSPKWIFEAPPSLCDAFLYPLSAPVCSSSANVEREK